MIAFLSAFKASRAFAFAAKWGGVVLAVGLALFWQFRAAGRVQRRSGQIEVESRVLRQRVETMKRMENVQAQMQSAGSDGPHTRDDLVSSLRDESY